MALLGPEFAEIAAAIPGDHARRCDAPTMLEAALGERGPGCEVLDLGCGDGRAVDLLRRLSDEARYTGVDIEGSPEALERTRKDARFVSYDGERLPFEDGAFDIVFSQQVFEHVRHPDVLIRDVARVLRPGGRFVGSLSYLEPYHSYSIFNFTPYGLFRVTEDNGLRLREMRPGIEGITLIARQVSMRRIDGLALAYPLIEAAGRLRGWDAQRRNYLKLRLAGHICFFAEKPATAPVFRGAARLP